MSWVADRPTLKQTLLYTEISFKYQIPAYFWSSWRGDPILFQCIVEQKELKQGVTHQIVSNPYLAYLVLRIQLKSRWIKNYTSSHRVVPLPHPLLRLLCASHLPLNDLQVTDTVIDLGRGGWISKAPFSQVRSAVVIFPFYNIFLQFYNAGQESVCRWSRDD